MPKLSREGLYGINPDKTPTLPRTTLSLSSVQDISVADPISASLQFK